MADKLKLVEESVEDRMHREVAEKCKADPNCTYHEGDDDGDEAFVFFDNHMEHHSKGKVTRKAIIRR